MMKKKAKSRRKLNQSRVRKARQDALLGSKAVRLWQRRLAGCLRFLREIDKLPTSHKDNWAKGNWEYYKKQVNALLDGCPKGTERVVAAVRKELNSLKL